MSYYHIGRSGHALNIDLFSFIYIRLKNSNRRTTIDSSEMHVLNIGISLIQFTKTNAVFTIFLVCFLKNAAIL